MARSIARAHLSAGDDSLRLEYQILGDLVNQRIASVDIALGGQRQHCAYAAFRVFAQDGAKQIGHGGHVGAFQVAHHPVIEKRDTVVFQEQDVAGMRVRVKQPVFEYLSANGLAAENGYALRIAVARAVLVQLVDADPVNPVHCQDLGGRQLWVGSGYENLPRVVKVLAKPIDGSRFGCEVEFAPNGPAQTHRLRPPDRSRSTRVHARPSIRRCGASGSDRTLPY